MNRDEESYANYLKDLIQSHLSTSHEMLLDRLWRKEFYSILPNDQNRAQDGILLREILGSQVDYSIFGPCRILEMLIALSKRMEFQIEGLTNAQDYVDIFWDLLNNLNLLKFDNLAVLQDAQTLELDHILNTWLDRKYSPDGSGGIFPLYTWTKTKHRPQQKVEIWYHMMLYLAENYSF